MRFLFARNFRLEYLYSCNADNRLVASTLTSRVSTDDKVNLHPGATRTDVVYSALILALRWNKQEQHMNILLPTMVDTLICNAFSRS